MTLWLLFMTLIKVVEADDLNPVSNYVGQSVTLHSGVDPSWSLESITWYIFTNTTWIATCNNGSCDGDHFYRYKGRLQLDRSTGNLVIKNLTREDEMEYTVDLFNTNRQNKVNKIKLTVKQQLKPPQIQQFPSRVEDGCLTSLYCSSPDSGVTLSWQTDAQLDTSSIKINKSLSLLVFLLPTKTIQVTCISSKNTDDIKTSVSLTCEDPPVTSPTPRAGPSPTPSSKVYEIYRSPVFMALGFFLGFLAALIIYCIKRKEGKPTPEPEVQTPKD